MLNKQIALFFMGTITGRYILIMIALVFNLNNKKTQQVKLNKIPNLNEKNNHELSMAHSCPTLDYRNNKQRKTHDRYY
ncbi:MAG TPA: hypothetical protein DCL21_04450 [Alphaproteobacteria bacterium]|nr:hypothetical protein [Alphaproteobacteria bacterium]